MRASSPYNTCDVRYTSAQKNGERPRRATYEQVKCRRRMPHEQAKRRRGFANEASNLEAVQNKTYEVARGMTELRRTTHEGSSRGTGPSHEAAKRTSRQNAEHVLDISRTNTQSIEHARCMSKHTVEHSFWTRDDNIEYVLGT